MGQDRTAVVGAFGVPSVAYDREKAGNEGPVLADFVAEIGIPTARNGWCIF